MPDISTLAFFAVFGPASSSAADYVACCSGWLAVGFSGRLCVARAGYFNSQQPDI